METSKRMVKVAGMEFVVWSDLLKGGTFASKGGEVKKLSGGSYLRNDLTVRKAIAVAFELNTFRK